MLWRIWWNSDDFVHLFAEYVGLPELKGVIYGKEKKKRDSNPRKNIGITAKELESSSSPNEISENKILKMEAKNENKIKQENDIEDVSGINADEEKK
ncbi:hypothetical protein TNCV_4929601 [Trichonephila clavipes]|nr:hypothetical protein TNCV_4929601 [Trichonephila clavipes]